MRALLAAYEQFLETNNRGDMAHRLRRGAEASGLVPDRSREDCWTELPDVIWTPLQRRLLDALPGERIVPRALAMRGATPPRRLGDARVDRVEPEVRRASARVLDVAESARHSASPHIELFHAGGREAEIEEVFRRILQAGVPLDEVEIACASTEYAPLVWEKAAAARLARHASAPACRPPSRVPAAPLLAFCEWIESDFQPSNLRRLLQSGDMRFA